MTGIEFKNYGHPHVSVLYDELPYIAPGPGYSPVTGVYELMAEVSGQISELYPYYTIVWKCYSIGPTETTYSVDETNYDAAIIVGCHAIEDCLLLVINSIAKEAVGPIPLFQLVVDWINAKSRVGAQLRP